MNRREEFTVDGRARLDVEVRSGSLEIRSGRDGAFVVTIASESADDWDVSCAGDTVSIRPPTGWRSRSARVVVEAPTGTDVDAHTASAGVALAGELGLARVRTASGDVRAGTVADLDVNTASGDVRVETSSNDVSTATVSGDVDLGTVAGRLSVTTASGDVRVRRLGGDAHVGTTSGDVRIERFDGSDVAIKCVSGDITLGLPSGIRVEPDIATLSGRTRLPTPAAPSAAASDRRVVRVRLKTVSGDITIERA